MYLCNVKRLWYGRTYLAVAFPISVVYLPDVLGPGTGHDLADLEVLADGIGV